MAVIERRHLRTDVRRYLVRRLLSQKMEPGSQIVERELAQELGVSRTPLREALLQLEFEGFLESFPGRGFMVRDLVVDDVIELFEVGKLLEPLALRSAGIPDPDILADLERIDRRREDLMSDPSATLKLVELDDRWHRLLVSECPNQQLLEILRLIRNRMYRYIYAFASERPNLVRAIDEHKAILRSLKEGNLDEAVEELKQHWLSGDGAMRRLAKH